MSIENLSVDSDTIPSRRGRLIGFDPQKRVDGMKIRAALNENSLPFSVTMGRGAARGKERAYPADAVHQHQVRKAEEESEASVLRNQNTPCA